MSWLQGQQTGGNGNGSSGGQQDQSIPDAPSTVQPAKPLPTPPQSTEPPPASWQAPQQQQPPEQTDQASPGGQGASPSAPPRTSSTAPPVNVRTVPHGAATSEQDSGQEDFLTIISRPTQVVVPVTVTDEDGHLVGGLTAKDFSVLENGKKQTFNYFSSSAFAVSAAVVIALGMKDVDLQKVNHTFPALEGAFSEFDELSVYTYSNVVGQLTGWGAAGPALTARLEQLQNVRGEDNGPAITSGPIA